MAEVNQKQHLRLAMAAAAKVAAARAQLAAAEADVEEAEIELRRLTASGQVDVNSYYRFFECEGDPAIRLSHGTTKPTEGRCLNFVSLWPQSEEIKQPKLCPTCKEAHELFEADQKGHPVPAPAEPSDAAQDIPF